MLEEKIEPIVPEINVESLETQAANDAILEENAKLKSMLAASLRLNEIFVNELRDTKQMLLDSESKSKEVAKDLSNKIADIVQQAEDFAGTADKFTVEGEELSVKEFLEIFEKTISSANDKIIDVSKQAMMMTFSMSGTTQNLSKIESFIGQIQKVTKQTHLLALNATIEASRAGESGKGFAVVADEVKNVSKDIEHLSETMKSTITEVVSSINETSNILQFVATTDVLDNLLAKERLELLMKALLDRSKQLTETLTHSTETTREVFDKLSISASTESIQNSILKTSQQLEASLSVFTSSSEIQKLKTNIEIYRQILGKISDKELRKKVASYLHGKGEVTDISDLLPEEKLNNKPKFKGVK